MNSSESSLLDRAFARRYAPPQLKIVAYLFMIQGFSSMASMILEAMKGKVNINLGVLWVLIGWGLLKLNHNSYRWAKFCCQVGLYSIPVFLFIALFAPSSWITLKVFALPLPLSSVPKEAMISVLLLFCAFTFAVSLWMLRVLDSEPVRRVFLSSDEKKATSMNNA